MDNSDDCHCPDPDSDTKDWGAPITSASSRMEEDVPFPTPASTSLATPQFTLELTPPPYDGMDDDVNIDDSFDENSFPLGSRGFAASDGSNAYRGEINVTSPSNAPTLHLNITRPSRNILQAQYTNTSQEHVPVSWSRYSALEMAAAHPSALASDTLQLDGGDGMSSCNAHHCDNCGCLMKVKYYDCRSCGVDGSYKLCVVCNSEHSCCTILNLIPDGRKDCPHVDQPYECFELCFTRRRRVAPGNSPIVLTETGSDSGWQAISNESNIGAGATQSCIHGLACTTCNTEHGGGGDDSATLRDRNEQRDDATTLRGRGFSSRRVSSKSGSEMGASYTRSHGGWEAQPSRQGGHRANLEGSDGRGHCGGYDSLGADAMPARDGAWGSPVLLQRDCDNVSAVQGGGWGSLSSLQCDGWGDARPVTGGVWGGATPPQERDDWSHTDASMAEGLGTTALHDRLGWQNAASAGNNGGGPPSGELAAAFRYLNIDPKHADRMTSRRILELYQAQKPDLGAIAAEKARLALGRIGVARDSWMLVDTYNESVDNTHGDATRSTTAQAWGSPSSVDATYGGPAFGKSTMEQDQHQLDQNIPLQLKDDFSRLLDEKRGTISAPPAAKSSMISPRTTSTGTAGLTQKLDFLHRCLLADTVSQKDRINAVNIVCQVADLIQPQQPDQASHHLTAVCGKCSDLAAITQLVFDLSAKLTSADDRLGSLTFHVHIEAKARASISDRYDKEFFRVGQDMTTTAIRIDGLHSEMHAKSANHHSELHALSAVNADSVTGMRVQLDTIETRLERCASTYASDQATQATQGEPQGEELRKAIKRLGAFDATISSLEDTSNAKADRLDAKFKMLEVALEEQDQSRVGMEQRRQAPGGTKFEDLKAMVVEHVGQLHQLAERLMRLEQPSGGSVKEQLAGLHATTTDIDIDVERANDRIGKLEMNVGEGLHDIRLVDLEMWVASLTEQADDRGANKTSARHSLEMATELKEIRLEMEALRLRRMDVDLREVNSRLDEGSETDKEILKRLERIERRSEELDASTAMHSLPPTNPSAAAPVEASGGDQVNTPSAPLFGATHDARHGQARQPAHAPSYEPSRRVNSKGYVKAEDWLWDNLWGERS
ncbi:hypothetical protein LTR36_001154 [Oleoguttula mirabilis]|uniref:Uncharacterized protein n=1 Tax=Oleoguttula mirabilis TaxID=1507867 RepID=A0AAV9JPH4_9PEZI|nr:hypothetical protein LTR36_001154 [Oleoguttula mirabilis]